MDEICWIPIYINYVANLQDIIYIYIYKMDSMKIPARPFAVLHVSSSLILQISAAFDSSLSQFFKSFQ